MTKAELSESIRQFQMRWRGKGQEDEDSNKYWLDFFISVLDYPTVLQDNYVNFEKKVIVDGHTKRIDAYIPETKVLIEQKTVGKKLDAKIHNSGDIDLTPYEQAKRYNDNLPYDEKARWIVTSNFEEIWIYDMNMRVPEPVKVHLLELSDKTQLFDFFYNKDINNVTDEVKVSVEAGDIVGKIYDAFLEQYGNAPTESDLQNLNKLCVRLVFCLYAEDAGLFANNAFHDYLLSWDVKKMRIGIKQLFEVLNTPVEDRDKFMDAQLAAFPYVNGDLFRETVEIPQITEKIKELLIVKASENFDWSKISPTIFGAVFESTLNVETRRKGGMHYTSIENIHKVIDPLFLDELQAEFDSIVYDNSQNQEEFRKQIKEIENEVSKKYLELSKIEDAKERQIRFVELKENERAKKADIKSLRIKSGKSAADKKRELERLQNKLASLTFLDPACGSGNFLTETYMSLRRLENSIIEELKGNGQITMMEISNPIKVSIQQFYGIEINDFAVSVARTAMWIAESQMMEETKSIVYFQDDFLPLEAYTNIEEKNALRMDWNDVVSSFKVNYIMGNPPFIGGMYMSEMQKGEIREIFNEVKGAGELDYVCAWYKLAAEYMLGTKIRAAFVSTNSICQGEQVLSFWKYMMQRYNIHIDYAYTTFVWNNEAKGQARVHCVIIGFSGVNVTDVKKVLYEGNGKIKICENISPYLTDTPNYFIESRSTPLCNVPAMRFGSMPRDGGGFVLSAEEREELIKSEPLAEKWIKPYIGAAEFLKNKERYCLWLVDAEPGEINKCPSVKKRIEFVRQFRSKSKAAGTRKFALTPTVFCQIAQPDTNYIMVPKTSSGKRHYLPLGFKDKDTIASDLVFLIPDAGLYEFGVLMSNVHNAWMRVVAGRLKSDYRYSKDIVYNNFPWCNPTAEQKEKIEQTAQSILDVREKFSNSSLADLYDPLIMPAELRKAHQENDKAVMKAYGFDIKTTTAEICVDKLMRMYDELVK